MWYSDITINQPMEDIKMKKLLALILTLTMVLALCACGGEKAPAEDAAPVEDAPAADAAEESDLAYVQGKGKMVVGITEFNPMDYRSADDPTGWIGFDADMAKAFAKSIGVEVEFIEIDWDNKIMELDAKSVDAVWNGMTLTPEALGAMECSNPYANNAQVVVVNADVADKYQDEESLKELNFAVEAGSAGEAEAKSRELSFTSVLTQADALLEVASGTSDACIIDLLMAGAMLGEGTSYPDMTYTVKLNNEEYGVGFRQGSDMAEKFNEFFDSAMAEGKVVEIATTYGVQESIIK